MRERRGPLTQLFGALGRLRNMDSEELKRNAKSILTSPVKLVLLVWAIPVLVVGIIWLLVSVGALNHVLSHEERKKWEEITVQILNGLFTLLAFLQQVRFTFLTYYLYRWTPQDVAKLEKIFCKDGLPKPHERKHMLVVILLTHLYCIAQYASAVLYWVYPNNSQRPTVAANVIFFLSLGSGILSQKYQQVSPLGKDVDPVDSNQDIPRMGSEGPILDSHVPKMPSQDQHQSHV